MPNTVQGWLAVIGGIVTLIGAGLGVGIWIGQNDDDSAKLSLIDPTEIKTDHETLITLRAAVESQDDQIKAHGRLFEGHSEKINELRDQQRVLSELTLKIARMEIQMSYLVQATDHQGQTLERLSYTKLEEASNMPAPVGGIQ